MSNLKAVLRQLQKERSGLAAQLNRLNEAIAALNGGSAGRRGISATGRARIAAAQRARWARVKGKAGSAKRILSAAARKRIVAAQRARWAAWRKQQKAA